MNSRQLPFYSINAIRLTSTPAVRGAGAIASEAMVGCGMRAWDRIGFTTSSSGSSLTANSVDSSLDGAIMAVDYCSA